MLDIPIEQSPKRRSFHLSAWSFVIAARGGEDLVKRLFEPLGYSVEMQGSQLDDKCPEWGSSPYVALTIAGTVRLQDLLTHLYVLIPVLDNEKHYWVAKDEIEKLLKRGEGWLGSHPEKDLIVSRYLKRQRSLTREALSRLLAEDTPTDESGLRISNPARAFSRTRRVRFGKTFTAYQLAKKLGAKRLLVLTFKPAVEDAWQTDLESHVDFDGWQYLSKSSGSDPTQIDRKKPVVYFGSFQDLLGHDAAGNIKPKNAAPRQPNRSRD